MTPSPCMDSVSQQREGVGCGVWGVG
eukprot:COSAG02_NODE_4242_length_5594_cov_2.769063_1_plen_25_part_10